MDLCCLVPLVQAAGGVMARGIFSWITLGLSIEHCFNRIKDDVTNTSVS